ncbi:MAG: M20/M25/M40 family metallo-hydrolase [Bryobacter sp.]|jgi:hypothetical protein|nr:M20/M25/M40 family metallo-hydrolase [Bryobacter sp.]
MRNTTRVLAFTLLVVSLASAQEAVDLAAIHRIKQEALQNSKVMDSIWTMTEVHGPRLTGSPSYKKSAEWVVKQMKEWGIDARLEKFDFGRGWSYSRFSAHMIEPDIMPLIGFPLAWSSGTNGKVTGEVVYAPLASDADLARWKGKLKGKIVMMDRMRELTLPTTPYGVRYTQQQLDEMLLAAEPGAPRFQMPTPQPGQPVMTMEQMRAFRTKRAQFLIDEGVAAVISNSYRGDGGVVFGAQGGSYEKDKPVPPPMMAVASEHYNRMYRLVEKKHTVKVEFEIAAQFHEDGEGYNVIAEIPGTGKHKDEYVLIGGHLDSWHGSTGATDNATGCAVMMETLRIIKTLNLKLDRGVRMALWGGEEQGLLGSRAYVKDHLANRETMELKKEHGRITGYFNIDNGSGKIRGIYAQGNDMIKPVFEAWLAPFKDMGATHVTMRNTSGTDHLAFDAVGVPGFQFIQDPLDYFARTHHSNMDSYDRVPKGDAMQMSAIVTSFVYNAAMRPEMLPRKPLPKPEPRRPQGAKPEATPSGNGN